MIFYISIEKDEQIDEQGDGIEMRKFSADINSLCL